MAKGRASGEKNSFEHMSWCGHNSRLQMVDVFWSLPTWSGKFCSLLPLLPWTWTLVWGKTKTHKPPPPYPVTSQRLYNPSADRPVGHGIDWLLPADGGGSKPRPLTNTNAICIHQPRNYRCQNQFIISFTQSGGWAGQYLIPAWIPSVCWFPVSPFATYVILLVFTCRPCRMH